MKKHFDLIIRIMTAILMLAVTTVATVEAACLKVPGGIQEQTLLAGQDIPIGSVTVQIVGDDLQVTYTTTGDWQLSETHLWVGTDLSQMPQTRKGTPKIGLFPYQGGAAGQTQTYNIPLSSFDYSCPADDRPLYVAAHAAVVRVDSAGNVLQQETAWGNGSRFVDKGMWGTFFTIVLTCDCAVTPPEEMKCETAFAYSGGTNAIDNDITNSFLDIDEDGDSAGDFNRWGWSNGAVGAGYYVWDLYAGAGQSDISKGTLVGSLTLDFADGNATVEYSLNPPYYLQESQLYLGAEILPRNKQGEYTVAPGQYPYIHNGLNKASNDSFYAEGLPPLIYLVAHAAVCGF